MLTDEYPELANTLVECCKHVETMGRTFFPERFFLPFSQAHKEVCQLIDDDSIQHLVIAAWRGFGKTSIVQTALPAQRILFNRSKFIVPISATSMMAVLQSENLKREIQSNSLIRKLWPEMKSDNFAKEMWVANNGFPGTLVLPRGSGQQIRGLLHANSRPNLFIVDDLEDSESVLNPERRSRTMEWFYSDVLGSTERGSKDYRIIVIGTVLGDASLLNTLLHDSNWTSVRYELCNDDFRSNWKEQMTDEQILDLYRKYQERGLQDVFYREYRNIPIAAERVPIKCEMFKYYTPEEVRSPENVFVVIVDPAKTTGTTACDTAIVGCGINNRKGEVYVVDLDGGQMHPDEMYRAALFMCHRIGARTIGLEVTGLDEFVIWPMRSAIQRSGMGVELVELRPKRGSTMYIDGKLHSGKESRIAAALVPLYRQGQVKHNANHPKMPLLEGQLLSFLSNGKKDFADALSYVVGLMDQGERYFMPEIFSRKEAISAVDERTALLDPEAEKRALAKLRREDKRLGLKDEKRLEATCRT